MRSGYEYDCVNVAMWRGRVASAMRGKRGQQLLKDTLSALDAMPEKRLTRNSLVDGSGDVCLLGAAAKVRAVSDIAQIDPEDHDVLANRFNVSPCMIQEIEFINDDDFGQNETPEKRFDRARKWLVENIKA